MGIIEYLDHLIGMTSGHQQAYYKMLRDKGKSFTEHAAPEEFSIGGSHRYMIKQCYNNAESLFWLTMSYTYYEGFYICDGIPIVLEHAFNVHPNGKIVDPTAVIGDFKVLEWFGVPVSSGILEEFMEEEEYNWMTPLQWAHKMRKI